MPKPTVSLAHQRQYRVLDVQTASKAKPVNLISFRH